jgi:hypothetical protein
MNLDLNWIENQFEAVSVPYSRNFFCDDFDQRGVLKMTDLGLRVGVINKAFVLFALKPYPAR